MKQHMTVCIDEEIMRELVDVKNKSELINRLLQDYFQIAKKIEVNSNKEENIIKEVEYKMKDQDRTQKIKAFLDNDFNLEEYKQGVKDKLWKSTIEYAEAKLNLS